MHMEFRIWNPRFLSPLDTAVQDLKMSSSCKKGGGCGAADRFFLVLFFSKREEWIRRLSLVPWDLQTICSNSTW
ncbi:hypothetical protein DsansV1_C17g0145071 [Dioscorea sansibarensis]